MARSPDRLDLLLSAEVRALLAGLPAGPLGPADALRLGTHLRRRHPAELVAAALAQRELRERAAAKFALAGRMWFTREGLEQASAEPLARHRAARYAGADRVADLCCGIGGDLSALARAGPPWPSTSTRCTCAWPGRTPASTAPARSPPPAPTSRSWNCRGRWRCSSTARQAGAAACRQGRATRRWPGAWSWPAGSPRSGSRPLPASPSTRSPGWEVELLADRRELKEAVWVADPGHHRPPGHRLPGPAAAAEPRSARAAAVPARGRLPARPQPGHDPGRPGRGPGPRPQGLEARPPDRVPLRRPAPTQPLRPAAGRPHPPWHLKRLREVLRQRSVGAVEVRKRGSAVDVDDLTARLRLGGDARAVVVLTGSPAVPGPGLRRAR